MTKIKTINTLQDLNKFLLPINSKYDYVYISIGSKINENYVTFSYPYQNNTIATNAEYQIIPSFIRLQPDTNNILSIIVDDFHDETFYNWNISHMQNILKCHKNIKIVIFNQNITLKNITPIIKNLNDIFKNTICPTHFLLCNFICFKSSNITELNFENELPNKIQKAMDFNYKECFYQWYGYSFYTYNYVYHYNSYHLQNMMNIRYITNILNKCLKSEQLNIYNIESIEYKSNKINDRKWVLFQDKSLCFT